MILDSQNWLRLPFYELMMIQLRIRPLKNTVFSMSCVIGAKIRTYRDVAGLRSPGKYFVLRTLLSVIYVGT